MSLHMHALSKRTTDRTEYEGWAASEFKPHWGQRISAAIAMADAKRCHRALSGLRGKARGTAAPHALPLRTTHRHRPTPAAPPPRMSRRHRA
jgi:hypothetical protein